MKKIMLFSVFFIMLLSNLVFADWIRPLSCNLVCPNGSGTVTSIDANNYLYTSIGGAITSAGTILLNETKLNQTIQSLSTGGTNYTFNDPLYSSGSQVYWNNSNYYNITQIDDLIPVQSLLYFKNQSSSVAGYNVMEESFNNSFPLSTRDYAGVTNGQLLIKFISYNNTGYSNLNRGLIYFHIDGYQTAGNKDIQLFFKFYLRNQSGDVLICNSPLTNKLMDTVQHLIVECNIDFISIDSSFDKFITEIYANVSATGSNSDIQLQFDDNTATGTGLPTPRKGSSSPVTSVNGKTGDVVLNASDVGALDNNSQSWIDLTQNLWTYDKNTGFVYNTLLGDVGIGTSSPEAKLDVVSSSNAFQKIRTTDSNSYSDFQMRNDMNSGTRAVDLQYSGSSYPYEILSGGGVGEAGGLSTSGAYPLMFGTNNIMRMLISSSGNIGIGTNNPQFPLHVYHSTSQWAAIFQGDVHSLLFVDNDNSYAIQSRTSDWQDHANLSLNPYQGDVIIGTNILSDPSNLVVNGNVTSTGIICDSNGCIGDVDVNLSNDGYIINSSGSIGWNESKGNLTYYLGSNPRNFQNDTQVNNLINQALATTIFTNNSGVINNNGQNINLSSNFTINNNELDIYGKVDNGSNNFERLRMFYNPSTTKYTILSSAGINGTIRGLRLSSGVSGNDADSQYLELNRGTSPAFLFSSAHSQTQLVNGAFVRFDANQPAFSGSGINGSFTTIDIAGNISLGGVGNWCIFCMNITDGSTNTGNKSLMNLKVNQVSKFKIDVDGNVTIGGILTKPDFGINFTISNTTGAKWCWKMNSTNELVGAVGAC